MFLNSAFKSLMMYKLVRADYARAKYVTFLRNLREI